MTEFPLYHKINGVYKRVKEGPDKGRFIEGAWSTPEFFYLKDAIWHWTEKIDGCLQATTRITMGDGSTQNMSSVRVGDEVLGMDEDGRIVTTEVLEKFNNGNTDEWITVSGPRRGVGRGNSTYSVHCTPNHRFWNVDQNDYVRAESLNLGDHILMVRSEREMTPLQKSVLIGKLLGDGSLSRRGEYRSWSIEWGQVDNEYANWATSALGGLGSSYRGERISGYGSTIYLRRTNFDPIIRTEFDEWHDGKRKSVPKSVIQSLDPIAIAFWYMDDGTLHHSENQEDRVAFATNGFTYEECQILCEALRKFDINPVIFDNKGWNLRLNANDAERLFLLVAPYIAPSMQYKLPERYRGGSGWMVSDRIGEYKPSLVEVEITSVNPMTRTSDFSSVKHDMATGTHNYFANGVLVHNCNIRVQIGFEHAEYDWREISPVIRIGGRTDNAQLPGPLAKVLDQLFHRRDHPSKVAEQAFLPEVVDRVYDIRQGSYPGELPSMVLYGEGYGAGIQKGGAYRPDPGFILFDIKVGEFWLERADVLDIAERLGLDVVPQVGYSSLVQAIEHIRNREIKSAFEGVEIEGLVGTPAIPLFDRRGNRIIAKVKTVDFPL